MNILWEREDDTFQNRAVRHRSRLRLLVAVQIRESTTEPLNSADTCAHSQKKPGTNYLAEYAVGALCFKHHPPPEQ